MGQIISINNQKGGVAKTTTAQALAQGLNAEGHKVLLVDLDPQTNLSFSLGVEVAENSMYQVLKGELKAKDIMISKDGVNLLPGSLLLSGADLEFTQTGREYLLKDVLEPYRETYDYIIIDTPPALGILTINSLTASDKLIIPMSADIYSLQGMGQLSDTIERVKKYVNPTLKIEGILLTKYNPRTILGSQIRGSAIEIASKLNTKLFNTSIRDSVAIREAQAQQVNLFEYAPKNNAVMDYKEFIREMLESEED